MLKKILLGLVLSLAATCALANPPSPPLSEDDLPLPVDVANLPLPVEVLGDSARMPILLYAQVNQDGPVVSAGDIRVWPGGDVFTVPTGKQLVIEHVSIAPVGSLTGDENLVGNLFVGPLRFFVGRLTADQQQYVFFSGSGETVDIRVPPGESPKIGGPSNVSMLVNYSLSGYLESIK